jgi:hypothetical protein
VRHAEAEPVLHPDRITVRWPYYLNPVRAGNFDGRMVEDLDGAKHIERHAALDGEQEHVPSPGHAHIFLAIGLGAKATCPTNRAKAARAVQCR